MCCRPAGSVRGSCGCYERGYVQRVFETSVGGSGGFGPKRRCGCNLSAGHAVNHVVDHDDCDVQISPSGVN